MTIQKLSNEVFGKLPVIEPVKVFEAYSEKILFGLFSVFKGPSSENWNISIAPDCQTFLLASSSWIYKWDIPSGKILNTMCEHNISDTHDAEISTSGKYALTAGYDGNLVLWNYPEAVKIHMFEDGVGSLMAVSMSKDEHFAVSVSNNGEVSVWDLKNRFRKIVAKTSSPTDVYLFSNNEHFLTTSGHGLLQKWNVKKMTPIWGQQGEFLTNLGYWHTDLAVSKNESIAIVCGKSGCIIFETNEGIILQEISFHSTPGVAIANDNSYFLTGSGDIPARNDIVIWDTKNYKPMFRLTGHKHVVNSIKVSPNGQFALSTGQDGRVLMWDLSSLQ